MLTSVAIAGRRRRKSPPDSSDTILLVSAIVPLLAIAVFGVASLIV